MPSPKCPAEPPVPDGAALRRRRGLRSWATPTPTPPATWTGTSGWTCSTPQTLDGHSGKGPESGSGLYR